jgi:hypothetical protein
VLQRHQQTAGCSLPSPSMNTVRIRAMLKGQLHAWKKLSRSAGRRPSSIMCPGWICAYHPSTKPPAAHAHAYATCCSTER